MKFLLAITTTAMMVIGLVSSAPQGVVDLVTRAGAALEGCVASYDGPFQAAIVDLNNADVSSLKKRATCGSGSQLMATLSDGVLKDAVGRTGYIAANYQFQFDAPPQFGALIDSGFSICQNGSVALGDSTVFYQCLSGSFSNLYDRYWAAQCSPVHLEVISCGDIESIAEAPANKIVGTKMVQATLVTVLQDGQPQVVPTEVPIPICQIEDGQIQGHTTPCAELPPPIITVPSVTVVPNPPASSTPEETTAATEISTPAETAVPAGADNKSPAMLALVVCVGIVLTV